MSKIYKYGIDISEWQGNIDLTPYKNQFVIIRGGYKFDVDEKAKRNMNECERIGIPYGIYWYSYALSEQDAKKEAEICLQLIANRKISVGVWFDMEDADGWKKRHDFVFTKSNVSAICNAFCKKIEKAGYYTGIYASFSWFQNYIDCPKYDKWVALWGSNSGSLEGNTSNLGSLQQYTSKPIDKNVMWVPISTFSKKQASEKPKTETKKQTTKKLKMPVIENGSTGKAVGIWQIIVDAEVDGIFGDETEAKTKAFQKKKKLEVDGIVGEKTWNAGLESVK